MRHMRMRQVAFQTAQSARGDRPLALPRGLRAMAREPPPPAAPFPRLKVFRDHRETKRKIARLEKAFQESFAGAARHIRRINRANAAGARDPDAGAG
jgi:hypothetical protein